MIKTYNVGTIDWQPWEYILIPGLIIIIYFLGARYKIKKIGTKPEYKYFLTGLMFKVFAGIFFGLIYVFYYGGGDTISYYSGSIPLANLLWENFFDYLQVMWDSNDTISVSDVEKWNTNTYNIFSVETGYPLWFISNDPKTFMVCKITSPILAFTGNSYFATTIILSAISFIPLWKVYLLFIRYFPTLKDTLGKTVLFIPSVAFWGSGIMKDTLTLSASLLFIYYFSKIISKNQLAYIRILYILGAVICLYSILAIKPYILNILMPAVAVWVVSIVSNKVNNKLVKYFLLPFITVIFFGGSYFVLSSLGGSMDKFALDKAVNTVVITQDDMKNNQTYGDNKFDIGKFDGSLGSFISKIPQATFAGLFRPSLIEARSPVMFLSALENLFLLGLFVLTLVKVKLRLIINLIRKTPVLLFSFTYAIMFAYVIGITTPNFGALVRFKIPLLPFFVLALIVIYKTKEIAESAIAQSKQKE